jgi:hypothetical protein
MGADLPRPLAALGCLENGFADRLIEGYGSAQLVAAELPIRGDIGQPGCGGVRSDGAGEVADHADKRVRLRGLRGDDDEARDDRIAGNGLGQGRGAGTLDAGKGELGEIDRHAVPPSVQLEKCRA